MARKRMVDPRFWENEQTRKLSHSERLLFIGLISQADDYGKGAADPAVIKGKVFPFDGDLSVEDVAAMLLHVKRQALVLLYRANGRAYYQLPTWQRHQRIDRPTASTIPNAPRRKVWVREYQRSISTDLLDANLHLKVGCEVPPLPNDSPSTSAKDSATPSAGKSRTDEDKPKTDEEEINKSQDEDGLEGKIHVSSPSVPSGSPSRLPSGVSSLRDLLTAGEGGDKKQPTDAVFDGIIKCVELDHRARQKLMTCLCGMNLRKTECQQAIRRLIEGAQRAKNPPGYVLEGMRNLVREHPRH